MEYIDIKIDHKPMLTILFLGNYKIVIMTALTMR